MKKYLAILIIIILTVYGIKTYQNKDNFIKIKNVKDEQTAEDDISKPQLEKINVSGYHLVTYDQYSNSNSFIKTLDVRMEEKGNVKFVIGSIDENDFINERLSFEIELDVGNNTCDLLEKRYIIKENEYLFMDISEYNVLYLQDGIVAKSLVQNENNTILGKMNFTASDYILPFKYTLQPIEQYNALVIGNDITIKDGKQGSGASDETKDYYYLTKKRLSNVFENVNISRMDGSSWEERSLIASRKQWVTKNLKRDKVKNLDLVIIQLGDNHNEDIYFENDVTEMVEYIREYSPNAEIIWIGIWNTKNKEILNSLPGICERLDIEYINISDLNIPEYQASNLLSSSNYAGEINKKIYPNDEAMQIISNRIMECLKFQF